MRDIYALRELAKHARELAKRIRDSEAVRGLLRYAAEQEAKADQLEAAPVLPAAAAIPSGEPPIARAGAALKTEVLPEPDTPAEDQEPKP